MAQKKQSRGSKAKKSQVHVRDLNPPKAGLVKGAKLPGKRTPPTVTL